ncbi:adenylate/guanylate cyclase domain-containing protein [Pseudoduganella namucuonensis]|uniref:Adenylate cyclase, class 3 n=1 Tax=Pseudoduganella namucuonensis TaxID=1035707 RepID=A0A1I7KCI9_9BURK|nr:adenylate/guanylate cyclase domain-containing protein [Pseudoduganella namucuonensis]SFU95115.1 Adenylate cyclase, class 3 [Pseudoduganella namucuonensis]
MRDERPTPDEGAGPAGVPRQARRRLRFSDPAWEALYRKAQREELVAASRWGLLVALILALAFMWQDTMLSSNGHVATNIRIYLVVPLCLGTWYALRQRPLLGYAELIISSFLLLYSVLIAAIFLVFEPGFYGLSGSVGEGNFIMIILATFTLSCLRPPWALGVAAAVLAIYTAGNLLWTAVDTEQFLNGHFSNAVMTMALGAATCCLFDMLRRRQFITLRTLEMEKERYKELLYNLVPHKIATRIEGGEFPIADSHAEIAVLFSDLVGFTTLTQQIAPRTLVQLLNELFFEYDLAAERLGVEKIKTIGDGYMAACGPPVAEERRTVLIAQLALEMIEITRAVALKYKLPIGVRVGIHSGSLVAGVIGKNRYTYDMWGESVNMASRMESSGLPNRVQASESAYQRLADRFAFEARGEIEVKGIGPVQAYLLTAPLARSDATPGGHEERSLARHG